MNEKSGLMQKVPEEIDEDSEKELEAAGWKGSVDRLAPLDLSRGGPGVETTPEVAAAGVVGLRRKPKRIQVSWRPDWVRCREMKGGNGGGMVDGVGQATTYVPVV